MLVGDGEELTIPGDAGLARSLPSQLFDRVEDIRDYRGPQIRLVEPIGLPWWGLVMLALAVALTGLVFDPLIDSPLLGAMGLPLPD